MVKVVSDTGPLISISENCLLWVFDKLGLKAVIPEKVKVEMFDRPLETKRFGLGALRLNSVLKSGVIEVYRNEKIDGNARELLDLANSLLLYQKSPITIIQEGEAQALAVVQMLETGTLLIDERTTRLLIEDIDMLRKYMENRTGYRLEINSRVRSELEDELAGINVIRSAEVVAYAYERGLFGDFDGPRSLEAALWALKFKGCSINEEEIADYAKMLG